MTNTCSSPLAPIPAQRSATEDVLDRVRGSLAELAELNRLVWGSHRRLLQVGDDAGWTDE